MLLRILFAYFLLAVLLSNVVHGINSDGKGGEGNSSKPNVTTEPVVVTTIEKDTNTTTSMNNGEQHVVTTIKENPSMTSSMNKKEASGQYMNDYDNGEASGQYMNDYDNGETKTKPLSDTSSSQTPADDKSTTIFQKNPNSPTSFTTSYLTDSSSTYVPQYDSSTSTKKSLPPDSFTVYGSESIASTSINSPYHSDMSTSPRVPGSHSNSLTSAITGASAAIGTLLLCIVIFLFLLTVVVVRRKSKTVIHFSHEDNEANVDRAQVHSSHGSLSDIHSTNTLRQNHMDSHSFPFPQYWHNKELEGNEEISEHDRVRNPFYDSRDFTNDEEPPKYEAISDLNTGNNDMLFLTSHSQFNSTDTLKKNPLRNKTPPPVPPRVPISRTEPNSFSFELGIVNNTSASDRPDDCGGEDSNYTLLGEYFSGHSLTSAASYLVLGKISSSQDNIHQDSCGASDSKISSSQDNVHRDSCGTSDNQALQGNVLPKSNSLACISQSGAGNALPSSHSDNLNTSITSMLSSNSVQNGGVNESNGNINQESTEPITEQKP